MSWFGVSLNDIKGQLTSFTNEVLSEGLEGVEGDCLGAAERRTLSGTWGPDRGRGGVIGSAPSGISWYLWPVTGSLARLGGAAGVVWGWAAGTRRTVSDTVLGNPRRHSYCRENILHRGEGTHTKHTWGSQKIAEYIPVAFQQGQAPARWNISGISLWLPSRTLKYGHGIINGLIYQFIMRYTGDTLTWLLVIHVS